jgi:hypothetical protein
MNDDKKQIEIWLANKRWRYIDTDYSDTRFFAFAMAFWVTFAWCLIGTFGQAGAWAAFTDWRATDNDQAPPMFAEVFFSGVGLILGVMTAVVVWTFIASKKGALPHGLNQTQKDAIKWYAKRDSTDQMRCHPALVDYLLVDTNRDTYDIEADRLNRWTDIRDRVTEKNRLERELSMISQKDAIEVEKSVLDSEIEDLRSQISEYKTLN